MIGPWASEKSITPKILIITVTFGMDPMMGVEILGLEEEFTI